MSEDTTKFNAFYMGRRLSQKNRMIQKFERVDNHEVLAFAKVKISHFTIGRQYEFEVTKDNKFLLPGFTDIVVDAPLAPASDIENWKNLERADLQLQKAINFKPSNRTESLIDELRNIRRNLSRQRKAQFDAWLIDQLK